MDDMCTCTIDTQVQVVRTVYALYMQCCVLPAAAKVIIISGVRPTRRTGAPSLRLWSLIGTLTPVHQQCDKTARRVRPGHVSVYSAFQTHQGAAKAS